MIFTLFSSLQRQKVFHCLFKKMHSKSIIKATKSMKIQVLPALSDNFMYLIIDPKSNEAAVVDPVDPTAVINAVKQLDVNLTKILTTHHHWDHAGGNKEMCTKIKDLEVIGGDERIEGLTRQVSHKDTVDIGNLKVQCLATPCHTKGHICYYIPGTDWSDPPAVFTGDTLFIAGCGRFFEGTAEQMHHALNEILAALPGETKVYCGHEYTQKNLGFALSVEPYNMHVQQKLDNVVLLREQKMPTVPSTISEEKLINPFMRVGQPAIEQHYFTTDPVVTMGLMRADKDNF